MSPQVTAFLLLCSVGVLQGRQGYGPGEQEYGHFQVKDGGFTFYWLFYTQDTTSSVFTDRPLVIWLQGGPGGSSAGFGNFAELGPLHINGSARESSWAKHVNLLFIDNPVGTGFSYTTKSGAYTTTNQEIGVDLVEFIRQFYAAYPDFSKTPLYIFCESYGGKMVVEFAKQLVNAIQTEGLPVDFRGVALGDSWIDPQASCDTWGPFLLHTGVVDQNGADAIEKGAANVRKAIANGNWGQATNQWGNLEGIVLEESYGVDFYNILYKTSASKRKSRMMQPGESPEDFLFRNHVARDEDSDIEALMEGPVRDALGVPDSVKFGNQGGNVFNNLGVDFMKPVTSVVEELLDNTNIQVTVFSGQLDLIVDTPGTLRWVDALQWSGSSAWKTARRNPLSVDGVLEGYVKTTKTLTFYWIDRAGHMVPKDNPAAATELLRRVTKYDQTA